jgi:hypothetical protein
LESEPAAPISDRASYNEIHPEEMKVENTEEPKEKEEMKYSKFRCTKKRIMLAVIFLTVALSLMTLAYVFKDTIADNVHIYINWHKGNFKNFNWKI